MTDFAASTQYSPTHLCAVLDALPGWSWSAAATQPANLAAILDVDTKSPALLFSPPHTCLPISIDSKSADMWFVAGMQYMVPAYMRNKNTYEVWMLMQPWR